MKWTSNGSEYELKQLFDKGMLVYKNWYGEGWTDGGLELLDEKKGFIKFSRSEEELLAHVEKLGWKPVKEKKVRYILSSFSNYASGLVKFYLDKSGSFTTDTTNIQTFQDKEAACVYALKSKHNYIIQVEEVII